MSRYGIPLNNDKFGKFTVIGEHGRKNGQVTWLCECECGNQEVIRSWTLRNTPNIMCKECKRPPKPPKPKKQQTVFDGVVKECKKCKKIKKVEEFSACKSNSTGLQSYCKACKKVLWDEKYVPKPRPKPICKEDGCDDKKHKGGRGYCKTHYRLFFVAKYNHSKVCMKCMKHAKPQIKGYCHVHYKMYVVLKTEKGRAAMKKRRSIRAKDPKRKMLKNLRRRASQMVKKISKDKYKKTHFLQYLGCTANFLKTHLESQFTSGMSWDNYGQGKGCWNVDHIKPISLMNTDCPESIKEHCHYTNLQPLWFEDNLAKSNNLPDQY